MKKIYLVVGNTGEYDDYYYWNVVAYAAEEAAQARVNLLNNLLSEHKLDNESYPYSVYTDEEFGPHFDAVRNHPLGDPKLRVDYTGTNYFVAEVDFIDQ